MPAQGLVNGDEHKPIRFKSCEMATLTMANLAFVPYLFRLGNLPQSDLLGIV